MTGCKVGKSVIRRSGEKVSLMISKLRWFGIEVHAHALNNAPDIKESSLHTSYPQCCPMSRNSVPANHTSIMTRSYPHIPHIVFPNSLLRRPMLKRAKCHPKSIQKNPSPTIIPLHARSCSTSQSVPNIPIPEV